MCLEVLIALTEFFSFDFQENFTFNLTLILCKFVILYNENFYSLIVYIAVLMNQYWYCCSKITLTFSWICFKIQLHYADVTRVIKTILYFLFQLLILFCFCWHFQFVFFLQVWFLLGLIACCKTLVRNINILLNVVCSYFLWDLPKIKWNIF